MVRRPPSPTQVSSSSSSSVHSGSSSEPDGSLMTMRVQGLMAMSHSQHRNSNHPTVKSGWQMPRSRDQSETSNMVTIASDGWPRDAAEADGGPRDAAEATWLRTQAP